MLRITAIAATAVMMTAPAFAMGCSYGKHSASASAETFVPEYAPTAASASTVESGPLQSAPIDPSALVYEEDAVSETLEPLVAPEG